MALNLKKSQSTGTGCEAFSGDTEKPKKVARPISGITKSKTYTRRASLAFALVGLAPEVGSRVVARTARGKLRIQTS